MKAFKAFYREILEVPNKVTLDGGRVLTIRSTLGKQFKDAGAQIIGTENLFPAHYPSGQIDLVTYQLRYQMTVGADTIMPYNGVSYRKMAEKPEIFPDFWDFVGMESRPYFWGSAAIVVTDKNRVLLGKKLSKRNVYGNTLTPPGGIVEVDDFVTKKQVQEAFVSAAFRELLEETGFSASGFESVGSAVYWDIERSKGQAFVVFHADDKWLSRAIKDPSKPIEIEFEKFELVDRTSKSENLSPEGVAAMHIARNL